METILLSQWFSFSGRSQLVLVFPPLMWNSLKMWNKMTSLPLSDFLIMGAKSRSCLGDCAWKVLRLERQTILPVAWNVIRVLLETFNLWDILVSLRCVFSSESCTLTVPLSGFLCCIQILTTFSSFKLPYKNNIEVGRLLWRSPSPTPFSRQV